MVLCSKPYSNKDPQCNLVHVKSDIKSRKEFFCCRGVKGGEAGMPVKRRHRHLSPGLRGPIQNRQRIASKGDVMKGKIKQFRKVRFIFFRFKHSSNSYQ
ncbi:hypothetical protein AVEN_179873-1 [Araneus ventricosus]|uniref:Uncharacterized protein n=1 Tax=Araneus ventricosus TaxID=182803 RepID=A0A4Y2KKP4_ARAVE|nr:hypothetical protein AVEN_179873-1 [Araneus ventricosus]